MDELPDDNIEKSSDIGIYNEGRSSHWDSSGTRPQSRSTGSVFDRKVKNESGVVLARGERIFHDKFGYGTIINIDGHKLDIAFEKSGKKRVMDSFVSKA